MKTSSEDLALFEQESQPQLGPAQTRLWTIQDVGAYFRVPPATIRKWLQTDPSFPRGVRLGKHRRWALEEVLAWERRLRRDQAADFVGGER